MQISPTSRKGALPFSILKRLSINQSSKITIVCHNRWSVRERPEIEKVEITGRWPGWQGSKKAVGKRGEEP